MTDEWMITEVALNTATAAITALQAAAIDTTAHTAIMHHLTRQRHYRRDRGGHYDPSKQNACWVQVDCDDYFAGHF
jgi:hypothetical protein